MKRGLIVWDESELSRSALDERLERVRAAARAEELPAVVVYTDVWRSNHARTLVNFMPYWGRSLLVVPASDPPLLLCGNSPRVYPWLGTVTYVAELRPTKDFAERLLELASERGWTRVGVLDRPKLPFDIDRALVDSALELVDLGPGEGLGGLDETELAMRRKAIAIARTVVEQEIARSRASSERTLAAAIEGALRRGGMEDAVVRIAEGVSAPRTATRRPVDEITSAFVACEYRGHWVQLSRPLGAMSEASQQFLEALKDLSTFRGKRFDLTTAFPYRAIPPNCALDPGRLVALHLETNLGTTYGDTCWVKAPASAELL